MSKGVFTCFGEFIYSLTCFIMLLLIAGLFVMQKTRFLF